MTSTPHVASKEGSKELYKTESFCGKEVGAKSYSKRRPFQAPLPSLRQRAGGLIRWVMSSSQGRGGGMERARGTDDLIDADQKFQID